MGLSDLAPSLSVGDYGVHYCSVIRVAERWGVEQLQAGSRHFQEEKEEPSRNLVMFLKEPTEQYPRCGVDMDFQPAVTLTSLKITALLSRLLGDAAFCMILKGRSA